MLNSREAIMSDFNRRRIERINQWLQQTEDNDETIEVESEKIEEGHRLNDSVERVTRNEITESNILREGEPVQRHSDKRVRFDLVNRHNISDNYERISDSNFVDNIIRNLPMGTSASTSASEEMESTEIYEDMGGDNDDDGRRDENFIGTIEEEHDNVLCRLASVMYCQPLSGIHRYISTIIVPSGVNGISECLSELDQLIEQYPPRHWYIISVHDDHVHVSHICNYVSNTCRCSWLVRSTFWARERRARLRRVSREIELTTEHWRNIVGYLSSSGRVIHRIGGFSQHGRLCDRYKYLSVCTFSIYNKIT